MVTVGAVVSPKLRLLIVVVGVVILLLRWRDERIGQLVMSVQEGFAVSAGDGTDGGVHPWAGGWGKGGGDLT